jgi:hypothetical protein
VGIEDGDDVLQLRKKKLETMRSEKKDFSK